MEPNLENTYQRHPELADTLPKQVRKQRRIAAKLAPLDGLVADDKRVRAEIDRLLASAGYTKRGEGVTCLGYDVVHRERDGNVTYDVVVMGTILVEQLVALGMPRGDQGTQGELDYVPGAETFVVEAIAAGRSQGDTAKWAEVKPMKGAKVRTTKPKRK